MPEASQSFGEQAARFSLYAPVVALVLGLATLGTRDQPGVGTTIAVVNCCLIAVGLMLGVAALVSMKWFGPRRILGRAVVGVVFNLLIIALIASILLPGMQTARMKAQLAGRWLLAKSPKNVSKTELDLGQDGSFTMTATSGAVVGVVRGAWVMSPGRSVLLLIGDLPTGSKLTAGQKIQLGTVTSVDEHKLVMKTDFGDDQYSRE